MHGNGKCEDKSQTNEKWTDGVKCLCDGDDGWEEAHTEFGEMERNNYIS